MGSQSTNFTMKTFNPDIDLSQMANAGNQFQLVFRPGPRFDSQPSHGEVVCSIDNGEVVAVTVRDPLSIGTG